MAPAAGHVVRAAVRGTAAALTGAADHVVVGDIGRSTEWRPALASVDTVIHLAARAHVLHDTDEASALYEETNALGTLCLAKTAAESGVRRFIYLSSVKVNGEETSDRAYTAADEPCPRDAYARSKWRAELHVRELGAATHMETVIVRPPLVYGPGVQGNMARLAELARSPYPLPLASLKAKRSLLSLDNLVEAIAKVLDAPSELKRPFIVADPEALTIGEMIMAMRHGLGRRGGLFPVPNPVLKAALQALGHAETYRLFAGSLVADSSALGQVNWQPAMSTRDALAVLMQGPKDRNAP